MFHDTGVPLDNAKGLEPAMKKICSPAMREDQWRELLNNLVDEGQVRMEKIGSGNWYWSFVSEAKKSKEKVLHDLSAEHNKLSTSIAEIEEQIVAETVARECGDDMILDGAMDRQTLLDTHERLLSKTAALEKELASYSDSDPSEILRKEEETKKLRESAEKWTDYIESAEGLLRKITNNDRKQVASIMEITCGDEYIAGEGLKDL